MLEKGKWKNDAPKPSKEFHDRFEQTLKMIEDRTWTQEQVSETEVMEFAGHGRRGHRLKKAVVGFTAAAAAMVIFAGVCYQNPVWASNLPLIGRIFERLEGNLTYGEDYKDYAKPVENNMTDNPQEAKGQDVLNSGAYTQTVNGTTITLSETYCSGSALYLSMMIESQNPFPDTSLDQEGNPLINVVTEENYSFNPKNQSDLLSLEGEFTDDSTYVGVIRIELNQRNVDDSLLAQKLAEAEANGEVFIYDQEIMDEYGVKAVEIPDEFTVELHISQIVGYLANPEKIDTGYTASELEAMSDDEWKAVMNESLNQDDWNEFPNRHENWWMDGSWKFTLDIAVDKSRIQTAEVNEMNEDGIGVESVVKTPFEITVNEKYAEGSARENYFPVMLDAEGKVMDNNGSGGSVNTVSVKNYDTSTVYVYLCDYMEYMNELKGHKNEEGFKDLMDKKAKFSAEVHFD